MSMQTHLSPLAARFSAMQLRERRLVMLAAMGGVLLLAYALFISPAATDAAAKARQVEAARTELASLQPQLVNLRKQAADPDAALRQSLDDLNKQIAASEDELHPFSAALVTPAEMPRLLQSLLAQHSSLTLVSLKTQPAVSLLQPTGQIPPQGNDKAAPGGIYRHAVEITIAGSYTELTSYAAELERMTPRPLWSAITLKVTEYPRSELTFTLYTLSLDLPWLAV